MKTLEPFYKQLFSEKLIAKYPLRGCYVWLPRGMKFRSACLSFLRERLGNENYQEHLFPHLLTQRQVDRVNHKIANFEDSMFAVANKRLPQRLFLKPTGEAAIYPLLRQWVKSDSLPIKLFQVGSIFRPAFNRSNPMLKGFELNSLMEAHAAFDSEQDARCGFENAIKLLQDYYAFLGVPTIISQRPKWGNKPVSDITMAFDTPLPTGRTFQVGAVYLQGQRFAKAFDIRKNGEYIRQITFGVSERAMAISFLMNYQIHGDVLFEPKENRLSQTPELNAFFASRIEPAEKTPDAKAAVEKGLVAKVTWCGSDECGQQLEHTIGTELIGYEEESCAAQCIGCEEAGKHTAYFSHRYTSP